MPLEPAVILGLVSVEIVEDDMDGGVGMGGDDSSQRRYALSRMRCSMSLILALRYSTLAGIFATDISGCATWSSS